MSEATAGVWGHSSQLQWLGGTTPRCNGFGGRSPQDAEGSGVEARKACAGSGEQRPQIYSVGLGAAPVQVD